MAARTSLRDHAAARPGDAPSRRASARPAPRPPLCNTGVVNADPRSNDLDRYGWDWTATTHDAKGSGSTVAGIVTDLVAALDGSTAVPGKGLQGWQQSVRVFDGEGYRVGQVYWGGSRTDVHVVSTSGAAHSARSRVAPRFGAKTSRVDTRVDTLLPYERLEALLVDAAGQKATLRWIRSQKHGEASGRTLYVGAPSSWVQVRLYEKHLESPGQYVEGTNRVEVQLRPPSRSKSDVSAWSPAETFCASQLTRRVAAALGQDVAHPATLQKNRGTPDLERTLEHMARQYGPGVDRWLRATGGEVGTVLDYLLSRPSAVA